MPCDHSKSGMVNSTIQIPYNDTEALRKVLEEKGDKVCAMLVEPYQNVCP